MALEILAIHLSTLIIILNSDDCSRVKLTEIEGEEGSDYINANYLDVRSNKTFTIINFNKIVYYLLRATTNQMPI